MKESTKVIIANLNRTMEEFVASRHKGQWDEAMLKSLGPDGQKSRGSGKPAYAIELNGHRYVLEARVVESDSIRSLMNEIDFMHEEIVRLRACNNTMKSVGLFFEAKARSDAFDQAAQAILALRDQLQAKKERAR